MILAFNSTPTDESFRLTNFLPDRLQLISFLYEMQSQESYSKNSVFAHIFVEDSIVKKIEFSQT